MPCGACSASTARREPAAAAGCDRPRGRPKGISALFHAENPGRKRLRRHGDRSYLSLRNGEFAAMTKSDLINRLSHQKNIPVARAESIVDAIFGAIEATLCRGERIEIRGLGSFELRQYGAYAGRNPRTGDKVEVKPKRLPFFKVGKEMKERINNHVTGKLGAPSATAVPQAGGAAAGALDEPSTLDDASARSELPQSELSDLSDEASVGAS
jgi:integration host factor subunit beta